jgi:hypothetical protein
VFRHEQAFDISDQLFDIIDTLNPEFSVQQVPCATHQ